MTRRRKIEPQYHRLTVEDLEAVDRGEKTPDDLLVHPRPARQRGLFDDDTGETIVERMRRAKQAESEVTR